MKNYLPIVFGLLFPVLFMGCSTEEPSRPDDTEPDGVVNPVTTEDLIICDEGNWQSDNGQLSYWNATTQTMTNQWFRNVNGIKLGDTPNDIIKIDDDLIAIAVNWSNIIQYIHRDGTACGATENVPNNRRMCTDGKYLYVTSYAHICGPETFQRGYVAKIDIATKQVVATCGVGWEPEGIRYYKGRLFVANTGGYAFSENHDYETTIQILDAATMTSVGLVDTGCINLYGEMSQAGKYLCVNSCGDYYYVPPKTVILNCETLGFVTFDFPCTYNTTDGELFYTIGSQYSYLTGEYTYYIQTIDPETSTVSPGIYNDVVTEKIKSLMSPYELYISPYTRNIYFTDARSYATSGYIYGYDTDGNEVFQPQRLYINPSHILALPN